MDDEACFITSYRNMNGLDVMANKTELSEARRALLEKYLRGSLPQKAPAELSIKRSNTGNTAPLSFGQQQIWLLAQLMPDTPVYNECVTIHLP
ncbi:MAG: hypothetical protein ACRDHZ_05285, partial [Ktedonobacteraceae bacterium]